VAESGVEHVCGGLEDQVSVGFEGQGSEGQGAVGCHDNEDLAGLEAVFGGVDWRACE